MYSMCNWPKYSRIKLIQFVSDSKLQTINREAFFNSSIENITIPSSVTLIGKSAFGLCSKLQQIEIPNDSKLQKIDTFAFYSSSIKSITIPSELIELAKGWCHFTPNLTKVEVSPNNPRYCCYEGKMIIGKTNIDQSNYDCLIFCVRDIRHIKIPNFIEHICPYSFENCKQLEQVEIPNDSKLQTIDESAFSYSAIKSIRIPSSVALIGNRAFSDCKQLKIIDISNDSKLQVIDNHAFYSSAIESIAIPSSVEYVGNNAFSLCKQLLIVEINIEMISINLLAFKNCRNTIFMSPVYY